tara:strand:+ start:368 stop:589 length:222 start_codon:yes stop_codon:yes gene_type:complete
MSLEEFLALTQGAGPVKTKTTRSKSKRVGKKDPKMARALKKANALGRKKSGGFKKGYSQARIMKKAHQLRRKM